MLLTNNLYPEKLYAYRCLSLDSLMPMPEFIISARTCMYYKESQELFGRTRVYSDLRDLLESLASLFRQQLRIGCIVLEIFEPNSCKEDFNVREMRFPSLTSLLFYMKDIK